MVTWAIDVSKYDAVMKNGTLKPLAWQTAKTEDGLSLAIIKATEGDAIDPAFKMQWQAAQGILPRMAYHFFRPQRANAFEVLEEAIGDDFRDNDLICLDWEWSYWLYSKQKQRDIAYTLLSALRGRFDTNPYIYTGKPFADSLGISTDMRFEPFRYWLAQWPYDTKDSPVWNATAMDAFKTRIQSGSLRPAYSFFGRVPDMWQFTSRCSLAYLNCYPPEAAKKAVDYNAVYVDVSH